MPQELPPVYISSVQADDDWKHRIAMQLAAAGFYVPDTEGFMATPESQMASEQTRIRSRVFILLLSPYYLDSDEISRLELPHIRTLSQTGERRIISVILRPCAWQSFLGLARPIVIPDGGIRPLEGGSEDQIKDDLHDLAREVRRAMQETEVTPEQQPEATTPEQQAEKGPSPNRTLEPTLPVAGLALQLATKLVSPNDQAMATLVSPTLLVTTYQSLSQSGVLLQDTQTAKIEFLGLPQQAPLTANVLEVDEDRDFAVLELETPLALILPPNLVRPVDVLRNLKWESYYAMRSQPSFMFVQGTVLGERKISTQTELELEGSDLIPYQVGLGGAPVVAGNALIGILKESKGEQGNRWYAVPINEMLNSVEADAVSSLLPPDARRPPRKRSPWITERDFHRFSPEALNVLSDAQEISQRSGNTKIHMRDLLQAFLRQQDSQLSKIVTKRNVDILQILRTSQAVLSQNRGDFGVLTRIPRISVSVRRALSSGIANAGREGLVEDSHILAGVLSTRSNPNIKALNEHGITADLVRFAPASSEREVVLAGYQSDDATGKDLLDITPEVEALASVLAAKDVDPPLSLGLFGDWGTGKSFFMRKLEAEIKRLGDDAKRAKEQGAETAYCSNIVQISFNAWNYIDSDLWASLTSEIFENLAAAIATERGLDDPTKMSPEERAAQREVILAAASSSEAILEAAERKKAAAEKELKETEERLSALQKSEADIENALTPTEILRQALGFAMQEPTMKRYVTDISAALRIPQTKAAASEVQSEILQLKSGWDTIFFTLKNERRLWIWLTALGLAMGLGWGLMHYLAELGAAASRVLAGVVSLAALLAPFARTITKAAGVVNRAKESKKKLIEDKKKEQAAQLEKTRALVRQNVETAQKNVTVAHEKVKKLNEQLENMRADRRLADYIRERHQSTDYTQHLGIIARVRTDLRHLSTLLRDVKVEEQEEFEKAMKDRQKERDSSRKLFPRIDRIVLYIDDLDRCPEKNVVEVLQAVHLLLAFPLFVVVVGVDPRWLLYSLQQSSAAFRRETDKEKGEDTGTNATDDNHWRSTPLNYLEKIFQIPFSLRPIGQRGFGRLVDKFASGGATAGPAPSAPVVQTPTPVPVHGEVPTPEKQLLPVGPGQTTVTGDSKISISVVEPSKSVNDAGSLGQGPPSLAPQNATSQQRPINRNPEHLKIPEKECLFMKRLHEFIPTPRSGKRFINIYRLLRASVTENEQAAFVGDPQGGTCQIAMLLLGILTGYPEQATEILRKLIEGKPQGNWWDFVDEMKKDLLVKAVPGSDAKQKKMADVQKEKDRATEANSQDGGSGADEAAWLELFSRLDRIRKDFTDRPVEQFQKWAPRVARYSFQSGRVLYYQQQ